MYFNQNGLKKYMFMIASINGLTIKLTSALEPKKSNDKLYIINIFSSISAI